MNILHFFLHIDAYLGSIIEFFGPWTYGVLFAIIFAETGLVITPFLPGDSLLFAVGALAGGGFLQIFPSYIVMLIAAILGDTVNYSFGKYVGPKVFAKGDSWFFKQSHVEKSQAFYERYGGKTIILARFVPIVRTFAPFVAGIGKMNYRKFFAYNVIGAFLWVTVLTFAGYYFGGLSFVQENFEFVVLGIIVVSVLPMGFELEKNRRNKKHHAQKAPNNS